MEWTKEEIRTLRLRLGWTQSDLARRLHISSQLIDHWEVGSGSPEASLQQELELLARQASFCSEEVKSLPAAEQACDSSALDQIDFSRVKGDMQ